MPNTDSFQAITDREVPGRTRLFVDYPGMDTSCVNSASGFVLRALLMKSGQGVRRNIFRTRCTPTGRNGLEKGCEGCVPYQHVRRRRRHRDPASLTSGEELTGCLIALEHHRHCWSVIQVTSLRMANEPERRHTPHRNSHTENSQCHGRRLGDCRDGVVAIGIKVGR